MKTAKLWPFQESAVKKITNILIERNAKGCLVKVPTGHGKTFMAGEFISKLYENLAETNKNNPFWHISLHPVIYVTAASVEEQTQDDLSLRFGLDSSKVLVTSYSSLIAKFGEKFVKKIYNYETGEIERFEWHPIIGPKYLIFDECHRLKNEDSSQTKMGKAAAMDLQDCKFIFMSATPFTSPHEAEVIVRGIGLCRNDQHWLQTAMKLCNGCHPVSYDIYAMDNFRKSLQDFTVTIPHIRTKYKNHVKYRLIEFDNEEQRTSYKKAFEDYIKELQAIGKNAAFGNRMKLVSDNKFRERSEIIRADFLAREAAHNIREGFQVTIACNFQTTITKIVTQLVNKYGIPRDKISLVWGGGDKFTALKNEYSPQEIFKIFAAAIQGKTHTEDGLEITKKLINEIHKQIKQTSLGMTEVLQDESLRLGTQNKKERQKEINKFQSGETDICIFTFKAGSVGLSLHHCEDYYEMRPEMYFKEGDEWIAKDPNYPVFKARPRRALATPTWSAIEVIQAIGRPHRLTSMSDTFQEFIYYKGTVEEEVAAVAAPKLESLATLTKLNESWMNLISESRKSEIASLGDDAFNKYGSERFHGKDVISDSIVEAGDDSEEENGESDNE